MKSFLRSAVALCAVVLAGCSMETGPNISGVAAFDIRRVEVSPAVDTIFIPDTVRATDRLQFNATAFGEGSARLNVDRFVWAIADTAIAVVDSFGVVTPRRIGSVEISASATRIGRAKIVILPAANRVEVGPSSDTIFYDDPGIVAGDTTRLTVQTLDRSGAALPGVRYTWQSGTPGVATVDSTGKVRAVGPGTSTITVRTGELQATAIVNVLPVVRNVSASSPVVEVLDGDTVQLAAQAFDYRGGRLARSFKWSSSSPGVATVDDNGRVTFLSTGTATFTASTAFRSATTAITALPRELTSVAAGGDFACGIARLGRGYCWGAAGSPEFDVFFGSQIASESDSVCVNEAEARRGCAIAPKRHSGPARSLVTSDAGDASACAIDTSNLLYCWGRGSFGEIGNGSLEGSVIPVAATVRSERFTRVTVGGAHACALNLSGDAFCWGQDSAGQLGDNRQINSSTPIPVVGVDGLESSRLSFSSISAGGQHTCAIEQQSGSAYCWGGGADGQLGNGMTVGTDVPRLVSGGLAFSKIAAGSKHTCGVTTSQQLYCWGSNARGQLGVTASVSLLPTLVANGLADVSTGTEFTCALTTAGDIRCFGSNSHGQLGRGEGNPSGFSSTVASISSSQTWRSLSAGTRHVCAIDTAGDSWCWGSNMYGALGNSLQAAVRSTPQRVARLR